MKKEKTVNREVRVLEARELFGVTGGRGCKKRPGGPPPEAVGLPMFPPAKK